MMSCSELNLLIRSQCSIECYTNVLVTFLQVGLGLTVV